MRKAVLGALALFLLVVTASATQAAPRDHKKPERVRSKDDGAKAKLAPQLQQELESGSTASVGVFVTLSNGNVPQAKGLLNDAHVASKSGVSLVVGNVATQKLAKLAGVEGVLSVEPIQFKQTGQPNGNDPDAGKQPDLRTRNAALREFQKKSVPFSKAPPLQTSNFDQLKSLNVLDARTHNFTGAWRAGFTGTGVTASVLDGGTDWGHPDLIGTWQTWSAADADDPGWVGWPKAFDPYDTLVYLQAPQFIDQGLTWYTKTTPATCAAAAANTDRRHDNDVCRVTFATRTGPSRNIDAPAGTKTHTYTFPAGWSKSGSVRLASHPDDYLLQLFGERPAILLTDPNTAGVYDTAYVDLSDDYDFGDEKPVTKSSPVSYRDLNGDGFTDLSGGLLYFIADGKTTIPGGPTAFGVGDKPANGSFMAWTGDFDPAIEGHGTLTASNVVGQAVINGKSPQFTDLPRRKGDDDRRDDDGNKKDGGTIPGMVLGGAPNARLAPMGDIYFSFDFSTQFGYFLTNTYGVNVTSNSYGTSESDNDGMDAASQEADLIHSAIGGGATTPLFSTGNGAPGFGTVTAASPVLGIQVGASTQFGATGWDSIAKYSQVTDNDVIEWSNRGPGANGRNGVDVVADGSYSAGDATLNSVIDGENAWVTWGGTSRSTPVAVGATALIYQAYKAAHGSFPSEPVAKAILKSSAKDLRYGSFVQGSGSIDAGTAVQAARGGRAFVTPDEWRPTTDASNANNLAFPQIIGRGGSATKTFALNGPGNWSVSDRMLKRYDTDVFPFQSQSVSQESTSNFNAPDYLMNITDRIRAHRDADLVVIRANYPREQFDGDKNYQSDQAWRLLAYNWTDVNRDGRLWKDDNRNGVVNHVDRNSSSNIDGFLDLNFKKSEMEQGEYERFFYHRPGANELIGFVSDPADRMADGVYLGFQHSTRNPAIDRTNFTVEISYYRNVDWSWITETQPSGGAFSATINVPSDAPYGMHEGALVARNGSDTAVIPVAVTVAATAAQDSTGALTTSMAFGGDAVANAQKDQLYNNGSFFGANDWTWRAESGDWRFFYFNVPNAVPEGTLFLTDTTWKDTSPFTDLDTLVFGPSANEFQLFAPRPVFAPYILDTVGKSQNAYIGSGTWRFDTATGGPEEIVAAPASQGLHALVQHGVGFQGDKFDVPFTATIGSASVSPARVTQSTSTGSGSFDVTFKSSVPLPGFKADAFGLSQPETRARQVKQDNPDDPSTASVKENVTISHASRATFTVNVGTNDIDMFVLYDANNDGSFTPDEIIGSSTGPAGANELVTLIGPPDGKYQIWLHGFQVSGTPTVPLGVDVVQGNDLVVSGIPSGSVPANTPITLHVTYNKAMTTGQSYKGELLLGPSTAPTAVSVPVTISKT